MSALRERLERAPVPDALDAEARAWPVVAQGYAQRPRRRRRAPRAAVLAGAVVASTLTASLAAGVTTPGELVRRVLPDKAAPVESTTLDPATGRLLVTSRRGAWIVGRGGARRRLGPAAGATWSPHGLYVAVWGPGLSAVAPDGRVAWRLRTAGPVAGARWSPDGFRIAFRDGDSLAVVGGDGRVLRRLDDRVKPVAPAWRPDAPHTLAWQTGDGHVVVRDILALGGWRSMPLPWRLGELDWSADGRRLLARVHGGLFVARPPERGLHWLRSRRRVVDAAWAPSGRRLALVLRDSRDGTTRIVVARGANGPRRQVFSVTTALASVTWSPDGRRRGIL